MTALVQSKTRPHEVWLQVRDRVDQPICDLDGSAAVFGACAHMDSGAIEQSGAVSEPGRGVVVPGDDDDWADFSHLGQRLIPQLNGLTWRHRPVVYVARKHDRVYVFVPCNGERVLGRCRLGVEQRCAVKGAAEVPVGCVEHTHEWLRVSPPADRSDSSLQAPAQLACKCRAAPQNPVVA